MIDEFAARQKILDAVEPLPSRRVPLRDAVDGFAAEAYRAQIPLPGFDNSAMDGYAISSGDGCKGSRLRVTNEQPAGPDRQLSVSRGEAVRIFTGAPIPCGADAVVMQEDVTREGDHIVINESVEPGEFIRRRGCDLAEGQEIVVKGQRVEPLTAALLGSQGFAEVEVGAEVTACVISTGDEIVQPGAALAAGQIYDSNSILLSTLLARTGVRIVEAGPCPDDRAALMAAMKKGRNANALILSGGVSVGAHDLVQDCLRELGGTVDIWRVAIKPGKPFLFGHLGETAVFGLPGNPVSAFVTYLRLVRPALLKMMGASEDARALTRVTAKTTQDLSNDGDRVHYLRGRYERGEFVPIGRQESHALFGLSRSNALARVGVGETIKAGEDVEVELWA